MATTFQMDNGDVVMNSATGRPRLIGNSIGEDSDGQSKLKVKQDLHIGLSSGQIPSNASAKLTELVGSVQDITSKAVSMLISRNIRQMVSEMIRLQRQRQNIRPNRERIAGINRLQTFQVSDTKTSYRFILGVFTIAGRMDIIKISGLVRG